MTQGPSVTGRRAPWVRVILATMVGLAALFVAARNVAVTDVMSAFARADLWYLLPSVMVVLLATLAKTWRWRLLFVPEPARPGLKPAFWSLNLGQFLNSLLPMRVGDIARAYSLRKSANIRMAQTLATVIVEKSLDIIVLASTGLLLLPATFIPRFAPVRGGILAVLSLAVLLGLVAIAYQSEQVANLLMRLGTRLPSSVGGRLVGVGIAGIQGLAALRSWRLALVLVAGSAGIALLSVGVPLILFSAFDLPFGFGEAFLLHIILTLGLAPPSTPGKVLVFEGLAALTLRQMGQTDNAIILSYAIVYHLVVIAPQVVLGGLALARDNWRWPLSYGSRSGTIVDS